MLLPHAAFLQRKNKPDELVSGHKESKIIFLGSSFLFSVSIFMTGVINLTEKNSQ